MIVDEYRGVCNQLPSVKTNGQYLSNNWRTFEYLHTNTKKILLMDAYLFSDDLCVNILKDRYKPH